MAIYQRVVPICVLYKQASSLDVLKRTLCHFCHEESVRESKRCSLMTLLLKSMGIMGVLVFVVRQHPLQMTFIHRSV